MAEFDFPSTNLTNGQTYTANGVTFVWDSTNGAWKKNPASVTKGQKGEPSTVAGPPGADGTDGTDGTPGQPGQPGPPGADGNDGNNGIDGTPGTNGIDGTPGTDGADGQDGQDGTPGTNGIDGTNGTDGIDGTPGQPGPPGSATITNNAYSRVITGSNTPGTLNAEVSLTWNGTNFYANHTNGNININPSDGSIEITRNSGDAFIDFKDNLNDDYDTRLSQRGTSAGLKVWGDLEVTGSLIASVSLNVTNARLLSNFGTSQGSYQTALTCSITPTKSNSSILVLITGAGSGSYGGTSSGQQGTGYATIYKNNGAWTGLERYLNKGNPQYPTSISQAILDNANHGGSAVSYQIMLRKWQGGANPYILDSSSITLIEVP